MSPHSLRRGLSASVCLVWAAAAFSAPVELKPDYAVTVELRLLLGQGQQSGTLGPRMLELRDGRSRDANWVLQWPDPAADSRLELTARTRESRSGERELLLEGAFRLPEGRRVRLRRTLPVGNGSARLIEIYRSGDSTLTLAVDSSSTLIGWSPRAPSVGRKLALDLIVESVRGERVVELESNRLHTFEGESVSYSFRRGAGDSLEDVSLRLTPHPRADGGFDLEAEIDGSLPSDPERVYLQHREIVLLEAGASATLRAVRGDPPEGYRFRVRLRD